MSSAIYEEKQTMYLRVPIVALVVAVTLFGAWQTRDVPLATAIMLLASLAFAAALWGLTQLKVIVTPTEIRFGFPFFRKRFPLAKIRVGDVTKIAFLAGLGIHFWGGRWVFNARFGRGVLITSGRFEYLIGSDHPERLQAALMQVVPRAVGK